MDDRPTPGEAVLARADSPRHTGTGSESLLAAAPSGHGGKDGEHIRAEVSGHLDYLTTLTRDLGMPDLVEQYFAPVVGRWSDLHAEAERWRAAASVAGTTNDSLTKPMGSLDAAWHGKDADSFVEYMGKMGLAGQDMSDAMEGMAGALDRTADSIREIVREMAGMLGEVAESSSEVMTMPAQGEQRTRQYLDTVNQPTKELFESVRDVLEAFTKLCDGIDGKQEFEKVTMAHTFPEDDWSLQTDQVAVPFAPPAGPPPDPGTESASAEDVPATPAVGPGGGGGGGGGVSNTVGGGVGGGGAPSSTPAPQPGNYVAAGEMASSKSAEQAATTAVAGSDAHAAARGGTGTGGVPMMPMGGMGGQNGGDQEHKSRARLVGDPLDIFGRPSQTSPSVIGEDE